MVDVLIKKAECRAAKEMTRKKEKTCTHHRSTMLRPVAKLYVMPTNAERKHTLAQTHP